MAIPSRITSEMIEMLKEAAKGIKSPLLTTKPLFGEGAKPYYTGGFVPSGGVPSAGLLKDEIPFIAKPGYDEVRVPKELLDDLSARDYIRRLVAKSGSGEPVTTSTTIHVIEPAVAATLTADKLEAMRETIWKSLIGEEDETMAAKPRRFGKTKSADEMAERRKQLAAMMADNAKDRAEVQAEVAALSERIAEENPEFGTW